MTDSITAEVIRSYLDTAAEQIYETICRTSPNPVVSEAKDCGAGLYSYDGTTVKLIARAGIVAHSFALATAAQSCVDFFRGDLHPGDALVVGDSYHGGSHLGCWTVLVPIFIDGRPKFFAGGRLHVLDQGSPAPGVVNPLCRDIWHEGLRLPPLKLYERGERRRDVWDLLIANNRVPDILEADVEAMIGACNVGKNSIVELVEKHTLATVDDSLAWILGYSERQFRDRIGEWPDGEYSAECKIDTDYADGRDLRIRVKVRIDGDQIEFDFEGTDSQSDGFINSVPPNTIAYICIVLSVLCPDIPINAGFFEPLKVNLPVGTLVNPIAPAPTVLGTIVVGGQIGQAVMKACEQFAPRRAGNVALDSAGPYSIGSDDREHRYLTHSASNPRFTLIIDMSMVAESNSAAYGVDGWGGWATPFSAALIPNNEVSEVQYPILFEQGEYSTDSAAPGQWRGSPAYVMRRQDRGASNTMAVFNVQSLVHPLPGYVGGYEGAGNFIVVNEGREDEAICGEFPVVQPYDPSGTIFSQSGGGGGWGDPLDRDPQAVLDDILDGYVSLDGAKRDYGVVIDSERLCVHAKQTAKERDRQRQATPRTRRGIGRDWTIQRAGIAHRVS